MPRRAPTRAGRLLAALLVGSAAVTLGTPATAQAGDACLKLVFGRWCLGGDVTPLLQTPPLVRESEGQSLALVFPDQADQLYVLSYKGRIYKVVRAYRVATQLRFDELYGLLREKYGPGEDRSRFPEHAASPARRLASIRRGEGQAIHLWQPSEAWRIELSWTRELGLALAYIANGIEAERSGELGRGL